MNFPSVYVPRVLVLYTDTNSIHHFFFHDKSSLHCRKMTPQRFLIYITYIQQKNHMFFITYMYYINL